MSFLGVGAIILAAGKGTRMHSELPKVLFPLCDKPLLAYVIETVQALKLRPAVVVVGYQGEKVKKAFEHEPSLLWVTQTEMLGTGHAVQFTKPAIENASEHVVVLYGDIPLVSEQKLNELIAHHLTANHTITLLASTTDHPYGYGRINTNKENEVVSIVEEKDATDLEKKTRLINTGIGVYKTSFLMNAVFALQNHNAQKEYYLTDVVGIAVKQGEKVGMVIEENFNLVQGVNSPEDLQKIETFATQRNR